MRTRAHRKPMYTCIHANMLTHIYTCTQTQKTHIYIYIYIYNSCNLDCDPGFHGDFCKTTILWQLRRCMHTHDNCCFAKNSMKPRVAVHIPWIIYIYIYIYISLRKYTYPYLRMMSHSYFYLWKYCKFLFFSLFSYWLMRLSWWKDYFHRKWTRWPEFKFWIRLFAFYIAIILLGKGIHSTILPQTMGK